MDATERDAWREADRIFTQLLGLAGDQRLPHLSRMDIDDIVRGHVEALLANADLDLDWLDDTTGPGFGPAAATIAPLLGRRLGPWLIEGELGRGGMAVVHRASRCDGAATQSVALKVLTIGAIGRDGLAHLRREANILAQLEHPNIVGLIDAGIDEDGTPWLAMPLVEGDRIDIWCQSHGADTRTIVRLFMQVCAAVAHAHRNLIIHRDIKPSNVLVDGQGRVRLLDFGIARLADTSGEATLTLFHALTPGYAAPEQFKGHAPSTSMDVFGLGALLHQLLTGHTPHRDGDSERIVLPSDLAKRNAGKNSRHVPALVSDLDRVLTKALSTEPARRYGTAEELSNDLQRWLDNRPVLAQMPGPIYRLRKFVSRHRLGIAFAVLLAAAIMTGIGTVLWQAERTRQEAEHAKAVTDLLFDILRSADPVHTRGSDPRISELLEHGSTKVRNELARQPALQAELLLLIGRAQLERALFGESLKNLDIALSLHRTAIDGQPALHARTLGARALVAYELGASDDAIRYLREADALLARHAPHEIELRWHLRAHLADQLLASSQTDDAVEVARSVVSDMHSRQAVDRADYFLAQRALGGALGELGQHEAAIETLGLAVAGYRRHFPEDPALAGAHNELAIALVAARRTDDAEIELNHALGLQRRIYGDNHPTTLTTHANLATLYLNADRTEPAVAEFQRAYEIETQLFGDVPHPQRSSSLLWLALARYQSGDTDAALADAIAVDRMIAALANVEPRHRESSQTLLAVLAAERGEPTTIESPIDDCQPLERLSRLKRWACLAEAMQAVDRGDCRVLQGNPPAVIGMNGIERRWWAVYWLLQAQCGDPALKNQAGTAISLLASDAQPPFPDWLQARIQHHRDTSP